MSVKSEKNLDYELLLFYLGISFISFLFYITKSPVLLYFTNDSKLYPLILAYMPDLIIFFSIFFPYINVIIYLMVSKMINKKKISDNMFIILFFPLLSFFTKGFSLIQIYYDTKLLTIIKDNFGFYSFLLIGPGIVIFNKLVLLIHKRLKKGSV